MMFGLGLGGLGLSAARFVGGLRVEPVVDGLRIVASPPQSITVALVGGDITITGA